MILPAPVLQALAWGLVNRHLVSAEQALGGTVDAPSAWISRRLSAGRHGLPFELAAEAVRQAGQPAAWVALEHLATATLRIEAGLPRVADEEAWDAICRIVDPDLVALAHPHFRSRPSERPNQSELAWPPILRAHQTVFHDVCEGELSEVHAHLGGSLPTSLLWGLLISGALHPEVLGTRSLGATPATAWRDALLRARALLTHLGERARGAHPTARDDVAAVGLAITPPVSFDTAPSPAEWPLDGTPVGGTRILALALPERMAIARILDMRDSASPADLAALTEYIGIRCAFNTLLSQRPGHRGLNEFRAWYDRRSALWAQHRLPGGARTHRERLASILGMELLVESWLADHNQLGPHAPTPPLNLELRTSLPQNAVEARDFFRDLATGAASVLKRWGDPPVGLGIVHHVIKSARRTADDSILEELQQLWQILVNNPVLRPLVVGIDAASDELACPPRAFSEAFGWVRNQLDVAAPRDGGPPLRLGFTFHAGEDFRDLLTGLRHVDEAAHLLSMRPGDRLGHALALSWPVDEFYIERSAAFPTVGDHALDLWWASALLYHHGGYDAERRDATERLHALLAECGAAPRTQLLLLIGLLDIDAPHAPTSPRGAQVRQLAGLPAARRHRALIEADLLRLLGLEDRADNLADRPSRPRQWRALVEACQAVVRERTMRAALVIEINPSSNRVVGGFGSPDRLPYTRLSQPGPNPPRPNLPIAIGTDDAGIFHTSLRREYELVGQAALAQGFAEPDVRRWLDEIRQTARRASFLRGDAPRGAALRALLGKISGLTDSTTGA